MKILVTGANGYLGSGVVSKLIDYGAEVLATDLSGEHIDSRAKFISTNIFDIDDPYGFFEKPDVVLHMAWRDGFVHNSNAHMEDLSGHYRFIERLCDSSIATIAAMGTMHEVGFFEGAVDENTPCTPLSQYGIAKNALRAAAGLLCRNHGKHFLWLRGYYIVGNPQIGNSIFSKIYRAEQSGQTEFPFTSGKNQYDFVDYPVFCEQVAKACLQTRVTGIINIGSGHPESLGNRVERFIRDNGYRVRLKYGSFPDRPYDSKCIYGDGTKIQDIIAWFNTSFADH